MVVKYFKQLSKTNHINVVGGVLADSKIVRLCKQPKLAFLGII